MQYLVKMLDFIFFTNYHNGNSFKQIQKHMKYFYLRKSLESNGASFIVLILLELEILYFKE